MANKQIVEFDEKTFPIAADRLLLQDSGSGEYKQVSRGNLVRRRTCLHMQIGNGSGVPSPGPAGLIYLPKDCIVEIKGWRMSSLDGSSGSIQVDIWHDQNRISASDADSICGGSEPGLSNQSENGNDDLSSWTHTLLNEGCLVFNLDSVSSFTQVILALEVEITPQG